MKPNEKQMFRERERGSRKRGDRTLRRNPQAGEFKPVPGVKTCNIRPLLDRDVRSSLSLALTPTITTICLMCLQSVKNAVLEWIPAISRSHLIYVFNLLFFLTLVAVGSCWVSDGDLECVPHGTLSPT